MLLLLTMVCSAIAGAVIAMCVIQMPPEEDRDGRRFAVCAIVFVVVLLLASFWQLSDKLVQVFP